MRRYLFFFFLFLTLLLILIGVIGSSVMTEAMGLQNVESLLANTQELQDKLRDVYDKVENIEGAKTVVEEAALVLDNLRGQLTLIDLRKTYFRGAAVFLLATILITASAGIVFWFGMMRIFIRPLESVAGAMRQIGRGDFSLSIKLSKTKEIRFIQESVIKLAEEVRASQEKVKTMERQNIGRYLVHQVRNSITPIRLCTNVFKEQLKTSSPHNRQGQEEAIAIIKQETEKIENLITRFRNLYTFPEPMMGEIELIGLIREILKAYPAVEFLASDKELTRVPAASGEQDQLKKIYICGDTNLLEQAFGNIIDNAIEADPERVQVKLESREKRVMLLIADNGPGIPAEIRSSIFQDYITSKKQGMGIGLSFVKRVLDLHGFSIDLETEEGKGTQVKIGMPKL